MDQVLITAYKEGGLVFVLILAIIIIFFLIISHILKQSNKTLDMTMSLNEKWSTVFYEISENIKSHDRKAEERGVYVKREHEAMIENLTKMSKQNSEMIDTLGRINGYKHG